MKNKSNVRELEYPYNLLNELNEYRDVLDMSKISDDQIKGFEYCLTTFDNSRDLELIKLRYCQGLTYKACGEILGISSERVRQNLYSIRRGLRKPERFSYIKYGYDTYIKMCEDSIKEKEKAEAERLASMTPLQILYETELKDIGFSTRTFNAFRRGGYTTLGAIIECVMSDREWYKSIRNLGAACVKEVYKKLDSYEELKDI